MLLCKKLKIHRKNEMVLFWVYTEGEESPPCTLILLSRNCSKTEWSFHKNQGQSKANVAMIDMDVTSYDEQWDERADTHWNAGIVVNPMPLDLIHFVGYLWIKMEFEWWSIWYDILSSNLLYDGFECIITRLRFCWILLLDEASKDVVRIGFVVDGRFNCSRNTRTCRVTDMSLECFLMFSKHLSYSWHWLR